MRVTNNMIMSNTKININGNKTNVNTLNNQMTSQKKISRPSDDPGYCYPCTSAAQQFKPD